jgi:NTE family protein
MNNCRVGLALGAGCARGWAHIGVLRALNDAGIYPDIVAGTSIGAVVGGCYAAGSCPRWKNSRAI